MKQLVEYKLPDDSTIFVEVEEPKTPGPTPVAKPGQQAIKAGKTFLEALDTLEPMINALKQKINGLTDPADEVEVKFGVKLSGQLGAVITVGGEASYEITLRWKEKP
ncbi:MAG: CU044_2847 family protein [Microcystaceae cyanobacterium]